MSATIDGYTTTTPTTSSSSSSTTTSSKSLTSSDFLNLMIQQLQNQDPLNPTDSNQLLTQMSQISTLQSNTQMVDSLSGLTLQQSIGAGGNLIGKTVTGLDDNGTSQTGVVTSIKVVNKAVRLQLDNKTDLAMGNLTQISATPTTSTAATAATSSTTSTSESSLLSQLQQLLNSSGDTASTATSTTSSTTNSNLTKLASLLSMLGG